MVNEVPIEAKARAQFLAYESNVCYVGEHWAYDKEIVDNELPW